MPRAVEEDWETYDEALRFAGVTYGPRRVRMAVIGLGEGELLIVSPGVPFDSAHSERLARWGRPTFLLAPNHFHNAGLAWWRERFPEAEVVAHPRAHPRLQKKVPGTALHDLERLRPRLPASVRVFGPPMAKQGETWLSVATEQGTAWFVVDAILNERRLPQGPLGVMMRLLGFRPGLMANPFFMRLFLANKAEYREWLLAELERDRPSLFVPSHGDCLRGADVCNRLRATAEA